MFLLVLFALVALGFSFICSIMEAALLSTTPSFIVTLENTGKRSGKILSEFKRDINRPLAAILSLNTIANTVGAAGVGAQASFIFGSAALGIASGILTLLILVFSEIIPKTLGARYWRSLAPFLAYGLVVLTWAMYPFVLLSRGISRLMAGEAQTHTLSREELKALAELGERAGLVRGLESKILRNLFRFPTLQVKDIMTPRPVVVAFDGSQTIADTLESNPDVPFSRLPVYLGNIDAIVGYILWSDLVVAQAAGRGGENLLALKRKILSVPSSLPLSTFFDRLLDSKEHIALVVDEYGGTHGIATMEDVVETLLGMEIVDEVDTTEDMQALARAQWKKRSRNLRAVKKGS